MSLLREKLVPLVEFIQLWPGDSDNSHPRRCVHRGKRPEQRTSPRGLRRLVAVQYLAHDDGGYAPIERNALLCVAVVER
jgi:hypothetical protein